MNEKLKKLTKQNDTLRKNQRKRATNMPGPSEELAQQHTDIIHAAQKYIILTTLFSSKKTLMQCNSNLVLFILLTRNEQYFLLHAKKQAEYLKVFQIVLADL